MGEETAAVREVHERPGAVTHGAAVGEGTRRYSQRHGALCSALCKAWKVDCFIYLKKDRHFVGGFFFFTVIRQSGLRLNSFTG